MLNVDNILNEDDLNSLFENDSEDDTSEEESIDDTTSNTDNSETKNDETTEIDVNNIFTEQSESVGSEENKEDIEEKEDTSSEEKASPKNNFYSSIAKALKEEGVFPDLEDEFVSKITKPEDFVEVIEKQIQSKFDERVKRVDEALQVGVEPDDIKKYENTLEYFNSIKEDILTEESDKGEQIRKQLIYQDYLNRGYTEERAKREVTKSISGGTDIEDAKEALSSNKDYFKSQYDSLIEEAKAEERKYQEQLKAQANQLKKSILEDDKLFGELQLDKSTRQKVYDNISKPSFRDNNTGELYTPIQQYEREHKTDFLKNIGVIFTLTDGFKNLDGLVKNKVKKEVKKGLRELEHTLNNTSRTTDGSLSFVSGVGEDIDSNFKGWDFDV